MALQLKSNLARNKFSPYTVNRIDDIQPYTNLAEINSLQQKFPDVIYRDSSTGNQYTWDGTVLNFYNNITTGSVSSVSKSGNTILVNNTDPHNPIISTTQELNTTASPQFSSISLTTGTISTTASSATDIVNKTYADTKVSSVTAGSASITIGGTSTAPTVNTVQNIQTSAIPSFSQVIATTSAPTLPQHLTRKDYVDNLAGSAIQSISAVSNDLLSIGGTPQNPTLLPLTGALDPFFYRVDNPIGIATSGEKIQTNSTTASLVTQIGLGWSPVNCQQLTNAGFVESYYNYFNEFFPFYLKIIDRSNQTNTATYDVNSINTNTGYSYIYNVTYQSGTGTLPLANGTQLFAIVGLKGGPTTGANVGTGTGLIFKNKVVNTINFKSLTQSNGINISNGTDTVSISSDLSLYLNGVVNVNSSGLLTLDSVSKTGSPYSTSSNTMTINCDVIINGSLVLDSSSSLIVEGDILILGNVTLNPGSSLYARGCIHCRGRTSADVVYIGSSTIISFGEISFRNYSTNPEMTFASTTAQNIINCRSLVFDGNSTRIFFDNNNGHLITADEIIFSNNSYSLGGFTLHLYKVTLKANNIRFYNNTNANTYTIVFQDSDVAVAYTIQFDSNVSTSGSGCCVYFGGNVTLTSDRVTFMDNSNQELTNISNHTIFFASNNSITSNLVEFLRNYTKYSGVYGVNIASSTTINCETLQIQTTNATTFQNLFNGDSTGANLNSQYSTGRTPQYLIYNNGCTYVGFPVSSSLGFVPFGQVEYSDFTTGTSLTITNANQFYALIPASQTFINNDSLSTQFASTATRGEIQYIGEDTTYFELVFDITASVNNVGDRYSYVIYKNGSAVTSTNRMRYSNNTTAESVDISKILQLAKNDTISLRVANLDSAGRVHVLNYYNFYIKKMIIM